MHVGQEKLALRGYNAQPKKKRYDTPSAGKIEQDAAGGHVRVTVNVSTWQRDDKVRRSGERTRMRLEVPPSYRLARDDQ